MVKNLDINIHVGITNVFFVNRISDASSYMVLLTRSKSIARAAWGGKA